MADIIIRNAMIMQTEAPFEIIEGADVVIEGSMITAAGKGAAAGLSAPKEIDGSGKIVIPGNVCAHHHYYSGLSRGMLISSGPQTDFIQVLKEWWWRLDRALDEEAVYYSSLVCSLDAIAAGTTSCIDHHASPSFIRNSLSAIAKGMEDAGVRGATCFEITDRNRGMDEIREGYDENVRFASEVDGRKARGEDVLVEAMIGGHAPFTIPDEGLALMADAVEKTGRGMHLHVAEDKYDQVWSHHFHGDDIIRRLDRFSLLDERTLLVHGVHLSSEEVSILNDRGCFLAHNARSNMNNHIGYNHHVQDVKKPLWGVEKNIDPSLFIDSDGKAYLYFVRFTGGNVIWCAELNSDLKSLKEETLTKCIEAREGWERKQAVVAEGPSVLKRDGVYYLLYSANHFESQDYAVGYATATAPMGPWKNYPGNPILRRDSDKAGGLVGTGHGAPFLGKDGKYRYIYHAHASQTEVQPRSSYIKDMNWDNKGVISITGEVLRPVVVK